MVPCDDPMKFIPWKLRKYLAEETGYGYHGDAPLGLWSVFRNLIVPQVRAGALFYPLAKIPILDKSDGE